MEEHMKNIFDLHGKVALVTGASSGLGVQFAKALASEGADIAIVARRLDRLEAAKKEIEALGVKCYVHECGVMKVEEIKKTVEDVIAHYGKIDILVNNAGLGLTEPAEVQNDETRNKMIATNLSGVYFFAREVGKHMAERKYGKIINIGSIHSTVAMGPFPLSAYCTTKGGVLMLTKELATEWAKYNITVNAIGPAYFSSEMTQGVIGSDGFKQVVKAYCPMGRIGQEGELDGAIIYFASDASSYTTGQILSVDGGWTAI
jgi:NAD(P)-dependent dehydrogenase (short-subunit alcohol dehydrogenase family)